MTRRPLTPAIHARMADQVRALVLMAEQEACAWAARPYITLPNGVVVVLPYSNPLFHGDAPLFPPDFEPRARR